MKKNQENYRDLMYDIIETNKIYTVVQGIGDVVSGEYGMGFKSDQKDWFWVWSGFDNDIEQELYDIYLDTNGDPEGEYEFTAIFQRTREEGLMLEFIELTFIQTFTQRSRERALDQILDDDIIDIFNI
jgi:hypothetical protein